MIDFSPTASSAAVDEGTTGTSQPVVEADAGRPAEEARGDALTQPRHGAPLAVIPQGAFPSLARVAMEYAVKPYDDAAAFDFGLDLILDGLQRLLE